MDCSHRCCVKLASVLANRIAFAPRIQNAKPYAAGISSMILASRDKVRLGASGIVSPDVARVGVWLVTVASRAAKSKYDAKKQRRSHLYWWSTIASAEGFCREVSEIKSQAHVSGRSARQAVLPGVTIHVQGTTDSTRPIVSEILQFGRGCASHGCKAINTRTNAENPGKSVQTATSSHLKAAAPAERWSNCADTVRHHGIQQHELFHRSLSHSFSCVYASCKSLE
jgi:hypothetical protein